MRRVLCSLFFVLFCATLVQAEEWQVPDKVTFVLSKDTAPLIRLEGTAPETLKVLVTAESGIPVTSGKVTPGEILVIPQQVGTYHLFAWDELQPRTVKHCVLQVVEGKDGPVKTQEAAIFPDLETALVKALKENPDTAKAKRDAWSIEALYSVVAEYVARDGEKQEKKIPKVSTVIELLKEQEAVVFDGSGMAKVKDGYPKFAEEANSYFTTLFGADPSAVS